MAYEFARNHEFAPIIAAAEKPTYLDMMQASDQGIGSVRELAEYFALKSTAQTRSAIVRAREVLRGRGAERKANGRGRVKRNGRQVYTGPGGGRQRRRRRAAPGGERGRRAGPRRFVGAKLLEEDGRSGEGGRTRMGGTRGARRGRPGAR